MGVLLGILSSVGYSYPDLSEGVRINSKARGFDTMSRFLQTEKQEIPVVSNSYYSKVSFNKESSVKRVLASWGFQDRGVFNTIKQVVVNIDE